MRGRRLQLAVLLAVVFVVVVLIGWRRDPNRSPAEPRKSVTSMPPVPVAAAPLALPVAPTAAPAIEGESHLADDLNAPGGTIQRDLEILNELFSTWQTNFPHAGNPVGENSEITTALAGDNPVRFAFIARRHRAINAQGELCDRWGTPFRFHQLSGQQMEIRSAGPDRKFGTADDVPRSPPP